MKLKLYTKTKISNQEIAKKALQKKSHLNNKGQGLIEYLMLVALIAVATIGVVKVVGNNLAKKYEAVNIALGARDTGRDVEAQNANGHDLRQKDLSNFLNGSRNNMRGNNN